MKKKIWWGYFAGIVSGVTYGMNPLFGVPVISNGLDVNSLLFYRYVLAILLLGVFMLIGKISLKIQPKQLLMMALLGSFFTVSSLALFASYQYIPSGIATTVLYIYPIIVAVLMMICGQFPTWRIWMCILAGVAGAAMLSFTGESGFLDWRGLVLVFVSGLAYSLFIVCVNQSKIVKQLSNMTITFYCFMFGSIILFVRTLFGNPLHAVPNPSCWMGIAGLAIFCTAVATITMAASTKAIGATKTSILGILEPLTAIVIGTFFFHEPFTLNIAVGIALILFSIVFLIVSSKKPE